MTSVARAAFVRQHRGAQINITALAKRRTALSATGLSIADLRRADTNRDGKLDAREAFAAADRLDTDGNTTTLVNAIGGKSTRAGRALRGLAGALRNPAIRTTAPVVESVSQREFIRAHARDRLNVAALRGNSIALANLRAVGISPADLVRADRNGDGLLSAKEAFWLADRLDDDGNTKTLATSVNGKGTPAGRAATALAALLTARGGGPTGQTIADVARYRVAQFGSNYGVEGEWKSPNRKHRGNPRPDVRRVGNGIVGRWKCNLFGLDVLHQAGFAVPMDRGWYPCAVDIPGYARGRNRYFDEVVTIDFAGLSRAQKLAKIRALMQKAKPGDVIILDHAGTKRSDGGHTRIVVENRVARDGTVVTAEARQSSAKILTHGAATLGRVDDGEEKMYLLRPRRRRK